MLKLIAVLACILAINAVKVHKQQPSVNGNPVDHFDGSPVDVECHDHTADPHLCKMVKGFAEQGLKDINDVNKQQTLTFKKLLKLRQKTVDGTEYEMCLKVNRAKGSDNEILYVYLDVDILPGEKREFVQQANLGNSQFPFSKELLGKFGEKMDAGIEHRNLRPDDKRKSFPCSKDVKMGQSTDTKKYATGFIEDKHISSLGFELSLTQLEELGVKTKGLPVNYDARASHPTCAEPIQNQGPCGSCWVFASTTVAAQRQCIYASKTNKSATVTVLSKQDLVSCGAAKRVSTCNKAGNGCDGGDPFAAFLWMRHNGNSAAQCTPYQGWGRPKLGFVVKGGSEPPCKSITDNKCYQSSKASTKAGALFEGAKIQGEAAFKAAVFDGGPIVVALRIYKNFKDYTPAQYKDGVIDTNLAEHWKGSDSTRTMHAVVLSGWGVSKSGIKYWRVQNSWGEAWGDKGEFLILRGSDLMEIEQHGSFVNANPKGPSCPLTRCVTASKAGSTLKLVNKCNFQVFARVRYAIAGDICGQTGRYTKDDFLVSPGTTHLPGIKVGKGAACVYKEKLFCKTHSQCPSGQACANIDDSFASWAYSITKKGKKQYTEIEGKMCTFCHKTWKKDHEQRSFYDKATLREETKYVEVRKCNSFDGECCSPKFKQACPSNPMNCTAWTKAPTRSPTPPLAVRKVHRKTKHPSYITGAKCTKHSNCAHKSLCSHNMCMSCPENAKSFWCQYMKDAMCTTDAVKQCSHNPCKCDLKKLKKSKKECTTNSNCGAEHYCDASKHCSECAYVTKFRCDALDKNCCSPSFRSQCTKNPQHCTRTPTQTPTRRPSQILTGNCNHPDVHCVSGHCNVHTGKCDKPEPNAVAALATMRAKRALKVKKVAIHACRGRFISHNYIGFGSTKVSASGARGQLDCAIKIFNIMARRKNKWHNLELVVWDKKQKHCSGFLKGGTIHDSGKSKSGRYQSCRVA